MQAINSADLLQSIFRTALTQWRDKGTLLTVMHASSYRVH